MPVDWPIFIGQATITAVLASGLTLLGQRYVAGYQHQKNLERDRLLERLARQREQWNELRSRINPVLKTAGALTALLGGVASITRAEEIRALMAEFNVYPEQFTDHPDMQRALRDFQTTAREILDEQYFSDADGARLEPLGPMTLSEPPGERKRRQWQDEIDMETWRRHQHLYAVELPENYRALTAAAMALLDTL